MAVDSPTLQTAIEVVEQLTEEDQAYLIDIIYRRLVEKRREELVQEVAEAIENLRDMAKVYVFYDVRLEGDQALAINEPGKNAKTGNHSKKK